jgi:SOS response regulatory protein OraA/RecX
VAENLEKKLRNKANSLLSRRAYSREDLRRKLLNIADTHAVEAVLEQLEQLELLNDADYAYNFAFYKVHRNGWGPGKIRKVLTRHGVQPADIEQALVKIRDEFGEDYGLSDYLIRYWGKRGEPRDSKSVHLLIEHLLRRGHMRSSILRNLKRMLPSETMQYFGTGD